MADSEWSIICRVISRAHNVIGARLRARKSLVTELHVVVNLD
uniref:Uncharacterized protein n=1 Tax=Talaromyces marneffei PM1 TaxID=1077442 RepID=A0A093UW67_TALMA